MVGKEEIKGKDSRINIIYFGNMEGFFLLDLNIRCILEKIGDFD